MHSKTPYYFLAPALVYFVVFWVFRLVFVVGASFTNYSPIKGFGEADFVGLSNYATLLKDSAFIISVKNAFIYVLFEPICIVIGLFLALVLVSPLAKGKPFFRTLIFIPVITSVVAISFIWQWMYSYEHGLINWLLAGVGLAKQPFLSSVHQALACVMLMSIWQFIGLNMVIFMAGLQSIPKDYHDAAYVFGASPWRRFIRVTAPLLRPVFLFITVTAMVGSLQVFAEVYMLTRGGPGNSTMMPVLWMYRNTFHFFKFGYGAALAVVFFLIIMVLTLVVFKVFRRGGVEYY